MAPLWAAAGLASWLHGDTHEVGGAASIRTSLVRCPDDPEPGHVPIQAPACIDQGEDCSGKEDFTKLQEFAKGVDKSMEESLKEAKQAREKFLRRACDYRYAEFEDKGELLENTYGPYGPLMPGGSYLYDLRRWADATYMLHRACERGQGGCSALIGYLKRHPEDDVGFGGMHGKAGSEVYTELRKACEVGKTRSPVPNDGPVWCDERTGLCEERSCKRWWRKVHHRAKAAPWVDDRSEYDDIKVACSWIEESRLSGPELNKIQRELRDKALQGKIDFCFPKWVEGYCPSETEAPRYGYCTLKDGQFCDNGRIVPDSEQNETSGWSEKFKEEPVEVKLMPPPILLPPAHLRECGSGRRSAGPSRARSGAPRAKPQPRDAGSRCRTFL